jgi:phosphoribosyl-dephospho-CoA transferase
MRSWEINQPQVHDLLQIGSDAIDAIAAPSWVRRTLSSCPWVVVRRARAPIDEVAVGVRGNTRSERWGGFLNKDFIRRVVTPAELLALAGSSPCVLRMPALRVLQEVIEKWRDLSLHWGPTGSVGFELASGYPITTEKSDLDIAIRAPLPMSKEKALSLWHRVIGLQVRVDVRVETPQCGFSLQEYACTSCERILLHYADGVRLGTDPWLNEGSRDSVPASTPLVNVL